MARSKSGRKRRRTQIRHRQKRRKKRKKGNQVGAGIGLDSSIGGSLIEEGVDYYGLLQASYSENECPYCRGYPRNVRKETVKTADGLSRTLMRCQGCDGLFRPYSRL